MAKNSTKLTEPSGSVARALIRFVVVFVAALIAIHLLIWFVFVVFRAAVGQERQITGVEAARLAPPEPRLQPSVEHNALPAQDLERLRFAANGAICERISRKDAR